MTRISNHLTQTQKVLRYLKIHGHITQLIAWSEFRVWRLAARINDLRKTGLEITTVINTAANGSRYATYIYNMDVVYNSTSAEEVSLTNVHTSATLREERTVPEMRQ